jgi:regulator of protease activity HflC (stomatin/prohibitin superfamily)
VGSVHIPGWWWTNPIASKKKISLRVRSLNGEKLKVNDKDGNPVEIAAVVVWRVRDSAQAVFDVDTYEQFVSVQSETAVRHLASQYTYDAHDDETISLRGNMDQISEALRAELQVRLDKAGVEIIESRLSHLAYGAEIASAMLRRQQAGAVVAARTRIVEGAVGMVEMALARLEKGNMVTLDEERKAAMVSNLLVVLCSEHSVSPVVNAGTLNH